MTPGGLHYETYQGKDEWLMRIGGRDATPILFVPPLFEEMNRTRAVIAAVMRQLAASGHGCWLPDLSGTGESERSLAEVEWDDWRHDVTAAADHVMAASGKRPVLASLRGGCLIDDAAEAECRWRFAPVPGASLARDLVRAGLAGGAEWAGYDPSPALRAALEAASPESVDRVRTVQLSSSAGAADAKLPGPTLWRRSEPGTSNELAEAMAEDIASWIKTCAGS